MRRRMYARVYQHQMALKFEVSSFRVFQAMFEVLHLDNLLNAYGTNNHQWRLIMTNPLISCLPQWMTLRTRVVSIVARGSPGGPGCLGALDGSQESETGQG